MLFTCHTIASCINPAFLAPPLPAHNTTTPVQSITATTVSAGTLSLTYATNAFIAFQLMDFNAQTVHSSSLDMVPLSANVFDLGVAGVRWRDTYVRRVVTDRVATKVCPRSTGTPAQASTYLPWVEPACYRSRTAAVLRQAR